MADRLTLYTNPMSRGRIVRWMMEEVGAPYETKYVRYGEEMNAPAFTAMNGMAKVPVLTHGDVVITECAAICAYLADVFPEAGLAPHASKRGTYYRCLFFAAGPVEAAVTNKSMGWTPEPEQQATIGYGGFERMYEQLNQIVQATPYLCGDQFTAADVYLGSQVGWGLGFGTLPESPALAAYRDRIYAREAYKRASALDDAGMAEFGPDMSQS